MNKFNIKLLDGNTISLYFNSIGEALDYYNRNLNSHNITADDITIDTELDYVKYINEIINNSEGY